MSDQEPWPMAVCCRHTGGDTVKQPGHKGLRALPAITQPALVKVLSWVTKFPKWHVKPAVNKSIFFCLAAVESSLLLERHWHSSW